MFNVEVLTSAERDLHKIVDYISNELYNPDAALNLIDEFETAILKLADFPEMYSVHETDVTDVIFRKIAIKNYVVFYTLQDNIVYIAFVFHQLQDFDIVLKTFKF